MSELDKGAEGYVAGSPRAAAPVPDGERAELRRRLLVEAQFYEAAATSTDSENEIVLRMYRAGALGTASVLRAARNALLSRPAASEPGPGVAEIVRFNREVAGMLGLVPPEVQPAAQQEWDGVSMCAHCGKPRHCHYESPAAQQDYADMCGSRPALDALVRHPAQQDALRRAAAECADDLEAWIQEHYLWPNVHPAEKNRFDRDMGTVKRLRAALADTEDK